MVPDGVVYICWWYYLIKEAMQFVLTIATETKNKIL